MGQDPRRLRFPWIHLTPLFQHQYLFLKLARYDIAVTGIDVKPFSFARTDKLVN
jgi:hypothetical protein